MAVPLCFAMIAVTVALTSSTSSMERVSWFFAVVLGGWAFIAFLTKSDTTSSNRQRSPKAKIYSMSALDEARRDIICEQLKDGVDLQDVDNQWRNLLSECGKTKQYYLRHAVSRKYEIAALSVIEKYIRKQVSLLQKGEELSDNEFFSEEIISKVEERLCSLEELMKKEHYYDYEMLIGKWSEYYDFVKNNWIEFAAICPHGRGWRYYQFICSHVESEIDALKRLRDDELVKLKQKELSQKYTSKGRNALEALSEYKELEAQSLKLQAQEKIALQGSIEDIDELIEGWKTFLVELVGHKNSFETFWHPSMSRSAYQDFEKTAHFCMTDLVKKRELKLASTKIRSKDIHERVTAIPIVYSLKDQNGDYYLGKYDEENDVFVFSSLTGGIIKSHFESRLSEIASSLQVSDLTVALEHGEVVLKKLNYSTLPTLLDPNQISLKNKQLVFGLTESGLVSSNLDELRHILIAGTTGSGKTVFLNWLLYNFYKSCWSRIENIYLFDFKGGTSFNRFKNKEKIQVLSNFNDDEQILEAFDEVLAIMHERQLIMGEKNISTWDGKSIVLVIDEFANFKRASVYEKAQHKLAELTEQGRAYAIKVIIGLQRAEQNAIPKGIKNSLTTQFLFQSTTAGSTELVFSGSAFLERYGWDPKQLPKGRCIAYLEDAADYYMIQTPYASDEFVNDMLLNIPEQSQQAVIDEAS